MGKASRIKKERKTESSARIGNQPKLCGAAGKTPGLALSGDVPDSVAALLGQFKDDKLVVIDCNGVARGEEESRQMYWEDVSEAMCERRASCLPEMAALGATLNLSIFDVKVPVTYEATGERREENIFSAAFLLDYVDCFQWLLSEALAGGCDHSLLGSVFRDIVSYVPRLKIESPRMAMAIMMGKFMVNWFHGAGELEAALADSNKTMGQPFVLQIAKDYFASLAADKERAELESLIADQDRMAEANPHAVDIAHAAIESARDATRSLRI